MFYVQNQIFNVETYFEIVGTKYVFTENSSSLPRNALNICVDRYLPTKPTKIVSNIIVIGRWWREGGTPSLIYKIIENINK